MIVSDTNLIAYLLISGSATATAEAVLAKDPAWAAPAFWRSEMRNVLAGYLRKSLMTLPDALGIMADAESILAGNEHHVDSAPVLAMAYSSGCTAYDCEFVYLAQLLGIPLVTADKKVLREFPQTAISPEDFVT
ncbi:type II toxin-antitoxin system VapC family toxin [Longimicrobium sp.]|uniref:type II toxin-antitoxin system VapC family toxin n=1 Tax=Longimicrobium sp. TaxID=2029185 RepID=UPI002E35D2C8|nr:type II toxin-antitoxin system VapC family toxin [Longimicrobium sp.]HEX6039018.1 type II toxin-antitoxin system VapC family toxin [Longimicrobium sp.]